MANALVELIVVSIQLEVVPKGDVAPCFRALKPLAGLEMNTVQVVLETILGADVSFGAANNWTEKAVANPGGGDSKQADRIGDRHRHQVLWDRSLGYVNERRAGSD